MQYKSEIAPTQDTGWGLIFRLNDLLREIEDLAPKGEYDQWNFKLDRMWVNLTYRNSFDIEYDEEKNITNIKLCDEDVKVKDFIDSKILEAKREMSSAKKEGREEYSKSKDYKKAKTKLYKMLLLKDIWIKKLMNDNKLYIKEIKHDPAGAMWGK